MKLSSNTIRRIMNAVDQLDASQAFKALPDAHATPIDLLDAFRGVGEIEHQVALIRRSLQQVEQAITSVSGVDAGWPSPLVQEFMRVLRRSMKQRIIRSIEKTL